MAADSETALPVEFSMADDSVTPPQPAISALLASGFPVQAAIARTVRFAPDCNLTREVFPWRDASGDDRCLDIVAMNHRFVLPIECQKAQRKF